MAQISCGCNYFPASLGNVTFDPGVSVGVGTSAPRALLSFGAAVRTNTLYLYEGGGTVYGLGIAPNTLQIYSSSALAFGTSDGASFIEGMRLQGGKLGIGTTAPVHMLDVNGDINTTGGLLAGGRKVADGPGCYYA